MSLKLSKILACFMIILFLSACTKTNMVNTGKMPGHTFSSQNSGFVDKKAGVSVKRAKNGIYIVKDVTSPRDMAKSLHLQIKEQHLGPGEVKFDYENFKTRY